VSSPYAGPMRCSSPRSIIRMLVPEDARRRRLSASNRPDSPAPTIATLVMAACVRGDSPGSRQAPSEVPHRHTSQRVKDGFDRRCPARSNALPRSKPALHHSGRIDHARRRKFAVAGREAIASDARGAVQTAILRRDRHSGRPVVAIQAPMHWVGGRRGDGRNLWTFEVCHRQIDMAESTTLRINRAPVLTLWAAVVAERLGWPNDTALTLGQAVAGLTAHTKGVRLGIYAQAADRRHKPARSPPPGATGEIRNVPLLGRVVPVAPTADGPRAISKNALVTPEAVERYLRDKFGDRLCAVLSAMERLAATMSENDLNDEAFHFYERFRPVVPADERGWGAKGVLDLDRIHALARAKR